MFAPADMQVGDDDWNRLVIEGAAVLGVSVSAFQAAQLGIHIQELLIWNRKSNITAITDPLEAAVKHVVDSLAAAAWIHPEATLLDVGSGGGFPGIPLKIVMPSLSATLIDASRKKVSFQQYAIRKLGLTDIVSRQIRVETLADDLDHRSTFSVIICRAFTDLARFIETTVPMLTPSGRLLAMKGRIDSQELSDAEKAVGRLKGRFRSRTVSYTLPVIDAERSVYILESASPEKSGEICSHPD
jgi:16S rRNA (guanine527-N7)-methyltransferase